MSDIARFIKRLEQVVIPDVFNPYRDHCTQHDHALSPHIRRANLRAYLDASVAMRVDSLWLGRDCGYRGGRRTGIALTDENQLDLLRNRFDINGITKATVGTNVKERTATEVWKMIGEIGQHVFLWNVFPFHPHETGRPMSNRRHTTQEFNSCKGLLIDLLSILKPKRIVALGADAYKEVLQVASLACRVRHPSYGGQFEFAEAIRALYTIA